MDGKIPRNVFLLGLVSFFNDVAAEMIYPIVPIFLTIILQIPIPIIGLIEGVAEATASITKFFFGTFSDYLQRRKIFVVWGYTFGAVSKLLIGVSYTWPPVLFARFIDRLGKGIRTAPRDSLLLENTTATNKGFIFGFHRAFDSLGAVIGPLIALIFLSLFKEDIRLVFFAAFIPSIIAVLLLLFFVKEKSHSAGNTRKKYAFKRLRWKGLDFQLKLFLVVSFLFALGNSSDVFLLLRAKDLGFTATFVVLSYVLYNISQTVFAAPAGGLADRIGAKKVFSIGLLVFAIVYFFFGIIQNAFWFWILFPIYGIYIAFTDGVSKAYISQFIAQEESGTYFGVYYTLTALGNLLASVVGGVLWTVFTPSTTFFYGSIFSLFAFLLFIVLQQRGKLTSY